MSILDEIESIIINEFPNAIIHVETLDDDVFVMVDRDTYLEQSFKITVLRIKIDLLLKQRISNIYIVMDKDNRKFKKVTVSIPEIYKSDMSGYQILDPECELSLAA
ncbi:hypothetical protein SpiGrapes_1636 [Sphaerochaeta pleomorpha str. Grapes]|uniref:Uncharacterized protein n=1 Tax=Sphaerochaeta pleomorpha (strain ATCC BAA-1885 / DSM 22778 / Grapes) TaxID=158190 RepID=G8QWE5_SPHPG|nr:hypothetical protein [Sphaerochaeta pleomorpha]AEV29443.1 hypothetical protein SpiGrapes_1636 [Sphaerochaeta pleomorpha str. Grapes]